MRLLFLQSGNFFVLYFFWCAFRFHEALGGKYNQSRAIFCFSSISGMLDEINNAIFAVS